MTFFEVSRALSNFVVVVHAKLLYYSIQINRKIIKWKAHEIMFKCIGRLIVMIGISMILCPHNEVFAADFSSSQTGICIKIKEGDVAADRISPPSIVILKDKKISDSYLPSTGNMNDSFYIIIGGLMLVFLVTSIKLLSYSEKRHKEATKK